MPGRAWGYWTRGKLDILQRYLDAFTTATKNKAFERIYIDAFAGEPENIDRLTGESLKGSAAIALSIDDPPFTRLRFFEKEDKAPRLKKALLAKYPGRDLKVIGGDCNERIPSELNILREWNRAPTFAFVDPSGMQAEWRTLKALAQFKKGRKWKAELFLLFAAPMFIRTLPVDDGSRVSDVNAIKIDRMYGTEDWLCIYHARLRKEISPSQARDEYLNLMRWRLEKNLGYRWTHSIEVLNEPGSIIYYMIFATDHEAGNRIMRDIYAKAAREFPKMRAEARRLRRQIEYESRGQNPLLDLDDEELYAPVRSDEYFYEHEPPSRPSLCERESTDITELQPGSQLAMPL